MLIAKFELNAHCEFPTRAALDRCCTKLGSWQKLFARRFTRHSPVLDVSAKLGKVHEPAPRNSPSAALLPNVRFSA